MMSLIRAVAVVVVALVPLFGQETRQAPLALRGLDPVELVKGNETRGDDAWSIERGKARFVFATEANLRAFEKDPEKYGIQFGGACGRMGPGSGRGNPGRFATHEGKIYAFASDQCRDSFL